MMATRSFLSSAWPSLTIAATTVERPRLLAVAFFTALAFWEAPANDWPLWKALATRLGALMPVGSTGIAPQAEALPVELC